MLLKIEALYFLLVKISLTLKICSIHFLFRVGYSIWSMKGKHYFASKDRDLISLWRFFNLSVRLQKTCLLYKGLYNLITSPFLNDDYMLFNSLYPYVQLWLFLFHSSNFPVFPIVCLQFQKALLHMELFILILHLLNNPSTFAS